jgi:hypothetical protein
MNWYNINEASEIVGKSSMTVSLYSQKYKQSNPNLFNVEKQPLQKGYDKVEEKTTPLENNNEIQDLESKYEKRLETMQLFFEKQLEEVKGAKQETIDLLSKQLDKADYQLNKVLEQYSMAQLTIQNLTTKQEVGRIELSESVEDEYQELLEDNAEEVEEVNKEPIKAFKQLDLEEEIENIIQEKQEGSKTLRTTEEYMNENKPKGSNKSFADWLKQTRD